eukprot:gene7711-biopygen5391
MRIAARRPAACAGPPAAVIVFLEYSRPHDLKRRRERVRVIFSGAPGITTSTPREDASAAVNGTRGRSSGPVPRHLPVLIVTVQWFENVGILYP